jgi:hypothetical protein
MVRRRRRRVEDNAVRGGMFMECIASFYSCRCCCALLGSQASSKDSL